MKKGLQIGKRDGDTPSSINSVFRLIGNDEDALTYALGYCFSHYPEYLINTMKHFEVLKRLQGKNYIKDLKDLSIYLQESRHKSIGGRKDITIEFHDYRIVIEAKTDGSIPSESQLSKYSLTRTPEGEIDFDFIKKEWGNFQNRYLIPLAREKVPINKYFNLQALLNSNISPSINIIPVSWGQVINSIIEFDYKKQFYLNNLYEFIKKDYTMKYYDSEVIAFHVMMGDLYEMVTKQPVGYYFNGSKKTRIFNSIYFCPATGRKHTNVKNIKVMRRIKSYRILSTTEIKNEEGTMADCFKNIHCKQFPGDCEHDRIHVFELEGIIEIPERKQTISGGGLIYLDILDVLGS